MAMTGKNRIMIYGPKNDGTYVVEFRTAAGEALAISIPSGEARVVRYFQERMPYGMRVPETRPLLPITAVCGGVLVLANHTPLPEPTAALCIRVEGDTGDAKSISCCPPIREAHTERE
jgi:hypothetical protein